MWTAPSAVWIGSARLFALFAIAMVVPGMLARWGTCLMSWVTLAAVSAFASWRCSTDGPTCWTGTSVSGGSGPGGPTGPAGPIGPAG